MSHLTLYHAVTLRVETTDTSLLDSLEQTVTDVPSEVRGPESDGPTRTDTDDSDATRLTARVTFVADADGETAASDLYDALVAHDLPADATVMHYKSPVGLADAADVREWHAEDADCDCGSVWRPDEHTVASF